MSLDERIERLCLRHANGELDDLVEGDDQDVALLSRVLAAVRDGNRDPAALGRDLDELEEVAVRSGLDGLTTPSRVYRPPPAAASGRPVAYVRLCPNRACSRRLIEYGQSTESAECSISGAPLEQVRLEL